MARLSDKQRKAIFAKKHFLVKGSGGHGGSTKPNGIKIMDAEKTIKGMQKRRNKKRKELGLPFAKSARLTNKRGFK